MQHFKIALSGYPGAGKSTVFEFIQHYCNVHTIPCQRIKLAQPLYQVQTEIYRLAGRPLASMYEQDGALLTFLGAHFRKINPNSLIEAFATAVRSAETHVGPEAKHLIVCDDARPIDLSALREMRFIHWRVSAPASVCRERRVQRGDLTLADATHVVESGHDDGIEVDYELDNSSGLEDLRLKVNRALEGLML